MAQKFPLNTGGQIAGRPVLQSQMPLTYEEFLAMRGTPKPQAAAPINKADASPTELVAALLGEQTASQAVSSSAPASTAAANAAYNSAAMGGEVLPEVALAEPASIMSSVLGYAVPAAAIAYGGKAVYDFAKGKKLDPVQKAAMAIPTAGASLFSDKIQKKFGIGQNRTGKNQQNKLDELVKSGLIPKTMPGVSEGIIQDKGHGDKQLYSGKLKGKDVWGVSGMFDTFKEDWLNKYSEDQRERISQRLLDERLLDSKDGLTRITNQDRARAIAQEETMGTAKPSQAIARPVANNPSIPRKNSWQQ